MSKLKLKYEILVSGIYPFEGTFEEYRFKIVENTIKEELLDVLFMESVIYISPFIAMCCYPNSANVNVYLTLQKEEEIEIDYYDNEEYDTEYTNRYIDSLKLFESIDMFEKTLVLKVNNDIKFPIKMIRAYDLDGNIITCSTRFMKLNVPSLLNNNQKHVQEVKGRQNNRLNSGISYEKVIELTQNNKYYKNALSMYHASFAVSDHNVGFTLLVISLESLLGLGTYSNPERCECCGQYRYSITSTISQNVSSILMDKDNIIKKRIKCLYDVRSKFVHKGIEVNKQDELEIQEYVHKVLLMYLCVSLNKETYDHVDIMEEIQSKEYNENTLYKSFLIGLDSTSFDEKVTNILKIFGNSEAEKDD